MTHYYKTGYITYGCTEFTCKHRKICLAATDQQDGKYADPADGKNLLKPHLYLSFMERRWRKTYYKVGCREYEEGK